MSNRFAHSLSLLLLAAPTSAWSADAGLTIGLSASYATPSGKVADKDHLDGKAGYGFGLHFPVYGADGHAFRSRVDFISFNREVSGITSKSNTITVLGEYNYYFQKKPQGVYLIAGIGYNNTKREMSGSVYGLKIVVDATTSGLAYDAGVGFAINPRFAIEMKYMGAELPDFVYNNRTVDTKYTANATVMSLAVVF